MQSERPSLSLIRLMAWLSPAMPVGAFSYSHGLERAAHDGLVVDASSLRAWLDDIVTHGSLWNDAVLAAEAWRLAVAGSDLSELAELGEAMAGSAERHMETMLQGAAFSTAIAAWDAGTAPVSSKDLPYPVALGAAAGRNGIPVGDMLLAYLHAFVVNQTQAAIRLSVIGQSAATALIADMEATIASTAARAAASTPDDLGSCTMTAEIASMSHEIQKTRLFRS